MVHFAAGFLVAAVIAGILGFTALVTSVAGVARIFFVIFLVLAGVSLLFGRRAVT